MRNHDLVAADLGRSQLGLVTRSQLRKAGVDHRAVKRRTDARIWTLPFPWVVDLGTHPASWEKQVLAQVLAAGDGAVASHLTAAAIHGMLDVPRPRDVDVTVLRGRCTEVAGHLARIAQRRPGWPGVPKVLRILDSAELFLLTESLLEILWLRLLRDAGLAHLIEVQAEIVDEGGRLVGRVDILFRGAKLIIECQGRRYHDAPHRLDRDDARFARFRGLGYRVLPVTWQDLEPPHCDEVIAEIRRHLAAAGASR